MSYSSKYCECGNVKNPGAVMCTGCVNIKKNKHLKKDNTTKNIKMCVKKINFGKSELQWNGVCKTR